MSILNNCCFSKRILVPSRQLNVDSGVVLCKRIYHDVLIAARILKDNSYSEFEFCLPIVECYDDTNDCLFALKNVTLIINAESTNSLLQ